MTIIITGGAGFIGSNFVFYMMKVHQDYRIVCVDSTLQSFKTWKDKMVGKNEKSLAINLSDL